MHGFAGAVAVGSVRPRRALGPGQQAGEVVRVVYVVVQVIMVVVVVVKVVVHL